MLQNSKYKELLNFCIGTQNNKDIAGWQTLHEFDNLSKNKDFDAKVYKKDNRIVIAIAGSNIYRFDDLNNCRNILTSNNIPSQYSDTERLYNEVKRKYSNAQIESMGYSLGATLSNLLSHRTGIKSTVLAPIGSKHIADAHSQYFKYGDKNITTYGRKGDILFDTNLSKQSGNIYIIPDMPKEYSNDFWAQHLLHNYSESDIYNAKLYQQSNNNYSTGYAASVNNMDGIENNTNYFTREQIGAMTPQEFAANESAIMEQLKNGQIQSEKRQSYKSFTNPISGFDKIFTREEIKQMSSDEYSKNEQAIMAQLNKIGIPSEKELSKKDKSRTRNFSDNSDGKWVTINGNHVFIQE